MLEVLYILGQMASLVPREFVGTMMSGLVGL